MDTWIWIVIAVVAALLVAFVVGLVLAKRRRITLDIAQRTTDEPRPPVKGGYKAGGSISFSSGGSGGGTAVADRPGSTAPGLPADRPGGGSGVSPAPGVPADGPVSRPPATTAPPATTPPTTAPTTTPPTTAPPTTAPPTTTPPTTAPTASPATAPPTTAPPTTAQPAGGLRPGSTPTQPAPSGGAAGGVIPGEVAPGDRAPADIEPTGSAPTGSAPGGSAPTDARPTQPAPLDAPSTDAAPTDTATDAAPADAPAASAPADAPAADAPTVVAPANAASSEGPSVATLPGSSADSAAGPAVTVPSTQTERIEPAEGRLERLRGRLSRSQNAVGRSLLGLLGAGTMDEDSWTDVEDTLLLADLGAQASAEIADRLRAEVAAHGVGDSAQARALLRRVLLEAVDPTMDRSVKALPHDGRPSVLLVVGVNGTGKTTTTGKLARVLVAGGRSVVLGAADTFRAAAADQLATWAERAGATVVRAAAGADPASVAFDAVKTGIDTGADAVLIDTAGRLHTKTGLMDELGKVKRVVGKLAEADEVLLVLDATTGQNGLVQARVFADVVDITGIVLTKLDGTAKGGIVVAVQRALGVPVKLVGLGEGPDDLAPFEAEAFVDALLG